MAELFGLDIGSHWVWLGIGLILILIEMTTGSLYLVWPGVAALVFGLIVAAFPQLGLAEQLAAYAGLSVVMTLAGRTYFKINPLAGASKRPTLNDRSAQLAGRRVAAIDAFVNGYGSVRLDDGQWRARLETPDAATVAAGATLEIVAVEGATLVVRPTA